MFRPPPWKLLPVSRLLTHTSAGAVVLITALTTWRAGFNPGMLSMGAVLVWSVLWCRLLVRTGDAPLRSYFKGNAIKEMLTEFDRITAKINEPEPCTGIAAGWCPNCGTCTCPEDPDTHEVDIRDGHCDPDCPLHSMASPHPLPCLDPEQCDHVFHGPGIE